VKLTSKQEKTCLSSKVDLLQTNAMDRNLQSTYLEVKNLYDLLGRSFMLFNTNLED
jgi:hypothetical protein